MAKPSPNLPCPCGSGQKHKKCCQKYHKGALPATAEQLMRSRYSAYAFGLADYIIDTTHPDNPDYTDDRKRWKNEIDRFCKGTAFEKLKVLSFSQEDDQAFVSFEAYLSSGLLTEKSRFLRENGKWLYVDRDFQTQ